MGKLFLLMAALMGGVAVHAVDFSNSAVWDNIKGCCVRGVPEAATVKAASEYLDSVAEVCDDPRPRDCFQSDRRS